MINNIAEVPSNSCCIGASKGNSGMAILHHQYHGENIYKKCFEKKLLIMYIFLKENLWKRVMKKNPTIVFIEPSQDYIYFGASYVRFSFVLKKALA